MKNKGIIAVDTAAGLALVATLVACGGQQSEPQSPADEAAPAGEGSDSAEAPAAGEAPCRAESFEFDAVKAACEEGGVSAAKDLMKDYVKQAKAAGNRVKCSSCHDNTKTYTLADNAVEDLRAIIEGG